ncbi:MAG: FAD-dependent oxidoreductase [Elusimicrobia bacterium]|nr:FAD-dependent oxidoreductase [Elusimicrobiota bacterium]
MRKPDPWIEGREGMPEIAASGGAPLPRTGLWRYLEPYYQDLTPPCNNACLTGEDIVTQIRLVQEKRFQEAVELLMRVNPFPAILGRVCPHPCETPCNRKAMGGAVSIRQMERFLGDWAINQEYCPGIPKANGLPVAVIGSGPAGLSCAFYLRTLGHPVTVFEKENLAGGLLRFGIPEFRLPRNILEAELSRLERMGIQFELEKEFGKNLTLKDLTSSGFSEVVFAVGLGKSRPLGIPGENLPQVVDGVQWLKGLHRGQRPSVRGRVAVIGGGNTAMDCARCLLRLGVTPIVIYRRSKPQMPALPEEIREAEEEGVEFRFLTAPVSMDTVPEGGLRIVLVRMKLGERDSSGRPKPIPIPGSEEELSVEFVFKALGEIVEEGPLPPKNLQGGQVIPCGDCAGKGGTAAQAIRSGREAAYALSSRIQGVSPAPSLPAQARGIVLEVAKFKQLNASYFNKEPRPPAPLLSPPERAGHFRELQGALPESDILSEAARCFKCGTCNLCGNCEIFCPDLAIRWEAGKGRYSIDEDFCKGCGVCVEECPRAAIHMRYADAQ